MTGARRTSQPLEKAEGRYVIAWVDAAGARDPIALTSQVKMMRDGFERIGHKPALMLVVVADDELDMAVERVKAALEPDPDTPEDPR